MSYEGFYEYLCEDGHYFCRDAYDADTKTCPRCGKVVAYWHSVDQTNGIIEDVPETMRAPKTIKEIRKRTIEIDDSLYNPGAHWRKK